MITQSMTPRLRMRAISKTFLATVALEGVDFDVNAGEVHALVGENGAGKSTLMRILSGALLPDSGRMHLDGAPFRPLNTHDSRSAGVAMIYQELSLAPHLTVAENIVLGREPERFGFIRRRDVEQKTRDALSQLGHDDIPLKRTVGSLPLARRQVIEIARALAVGCRVLVLDEPTSSLSQHDTVTLFETIRRLKSQGTSIVYISHFLEEVKQISDRFTVLRDGRSVGGGTTSEATLDAIVTMMVGRRINEMYPRSQHTQGELLVEVGNLEGREKPRSVSLTLHRGEVLGLAGLVGAGRSEFLRVLFGIEPIQQGTIKVGVHSGYARPPARWRQRVGMVSEDRSGEGLSVQLSITDNIMMNLSNDANRLGFIRPKGQRETAARLIDLLGIRTSGPHQQVRFLSGGNQQKVALARLLHEDVDVLLLDEPTRGIDVGSKSEIYALIDQLAVGDAVRNIEPKGILMVSSYLPELIGVCDRIAVMCRGVLGPVRPVHEVDPQSLMIEATGQGAAL